MLSKKLLIILLVIVVAVAVVAVWLAVKFLGAKDLFAASEYSAVYTVTGDIYYGKLSWFPRLKLEDVWLLQRGIDPQSGAAQFGLAKFTDVFWGPVNELYLNADQIIFWTRLRNGSRAVEMFMDPAAFQQQALDRDSELPPSGGTPPVFQGPSGPPPSSR